MFYPFSPAHRRHLPEARGKPRELKAFCLFLPRERPQGSAHTHETGRVQPPTGSKGCFPSQSCKYYSGSLPRLSSGSDSAARLTETPAQPRTAPHKPRTTPAQPRLSPEPGSEGGAGRAVPPHCARCRALGSPGRPSRRGTKSSPRSPSRPAAAAGGRGRAARLLRHRLSPPPLRGGRRKWLLPASVASLPRRAGGHKPRGAI